MNPLPDDLIFEIARKAGIDVPDDGSKRPICCPFHDDQTASAYLSARNCFFCSVCTSDRAWGAKRFCEALGIDWQDALERRSFRATARLPKLQLKESPPSFTTEHARTVWRASYLRTRDDRTVTPDRQVYEVLERRGLSPAWEHEAFGILPESDELPEPVGSWRRRGYSLIAPMFDATGRVTNVQARSVRNGEPKTLFPKGSRVKGSAFADPRAREMLRGQRDPSVVLYGEGLTDSLALAVQSPVPVVCAPGTSNAATSIGPWVRGRLLLIALDCDAAGEAAVRDASRAALALGAKRVRRVVWPTGCKDACDVLASRGAPGLAEFLQRRVSEVPA